MESQQFNSPSSTPKRRRSFSPISSPDSLISPIRTPIGLKIQERLSSPCKRPRREINSPKKFGYEEESPKQSSPAKIAADPRLQERLASPVERCHRSIKSPRKYGYEDESDATPKTFTKLKLKSPQMQPLSSPDYNPVYFIRCHSAQNKPADDKSKVWQCSFEPNLNHKGESSHMLATCGENIVCLIDCTTGKVMKRYKDKNENETFYTLAWTTLEVKGHSDKINILAVGGGSGVIKLIHPDQLQMFSEVQAHGRYISCLMFHPSNPNILFSASADRRIIMWEIDTPNVQDYSVDYSQLMTFRTSDTNALKLAFSKSSNMLLAACDHTCYGFTIPKPKSGTLPVRSPQVEFLFPNTKQDVTIDSLEMLSDYIVATKAVGTGKIILWNLSRSLPDSMSAKVAKAVKVLPMAVLQYPKSDVDYLYFGYTNGLLAAGDSKGDVNLYNIENVLQKKIVVEKQIPPSRVLSWPDIQYGVCASQSNEDEDESTSSDSDRVYVNCVNISSNKDFIACGTDNNLVCVWKKTS